jgi:hypothetical protein
MGTSFDGTMSGVWFGGGAGKTLLLAVWHAAEEKRRSGFATFRL